MRNKRHPSLNREQEVLFVEDVMEILQVGKSYSYNLIKKLNAELEKEGYITIPGRVSATRFYERIYGGKEKLKSQDTIEKK